MRRTSEEDGERGNMNNRATRNARVVYGIGWNALGPENDGSHDRDHGQADDRYPNRHPVPFDHHDSKKKDAQGDFGQSHTQNGEGLPDHLCIHRSDGLIQLKGGDGLPEAVYPGDGDKEGVEKQTQLRMTGLADAQQDGRKSSGLPKRG